jgi:sulfate/thiosulfate transport system permease protein
MVVASAGSQGVGGFLDAITDSQTLAAVQLTVLQSVLVTALNIVMGTMIAWVLVRDRFPGQGVVNTLVDLPFALPTIVVGVVLLLLYGQNSPVGVNLAYTRVGIVLALMFETLPFVVRSVQPVLLELDREMEEAAASLGAHPVTAFRRIVFPNLLPAILSGAGLAFAKAIGEYGSVVLISGNIPFHTQVASVYVFKQLESDNPVGAAAVSVVLLILSLIVLIGLRGLERWRSRHDSA